MDAKSFIKSKITAMDMDNVFELQFTLLLHLEEGASLPEWLENKIKKRMSSYGFKRSEIISEAMVSRLAATTLAKSAQRQRSGELLQIAYLKSTRGLTINKLPDNGEGSIRIKDGEFLYNSAKSDIYATKTIDAKRVIGGNGYDYISLKYVSDAGGAQDNQIEDVRKFLSAANDYVNKHENNNVFSAIVDGDYIESKIPEFKRLTNDRVRVFTSDSYN